MVSINLNVCNMEYVKSGGRKDNKGTLKELQVNVAELLSKKDNANAVKASLFDYQMDCKSNDIKEKRAEIVKQAITTIPASDQEIIEVINNLSTEQRDVLMKYLYKLLSNESGVESSTFLRWHAKLLSVCGIGSILRVLTDKKVV